MALELRLPSNSFCALTGLIINKHSAHLQCMRFAVDSIYQLYNYNFLMLKSKFNYVSLKAIPVANKQNSISISICCQEQAAELILRVMN